MEEADGDLLGDGVNIAARLEGIAKPGTICLSEDAYRQVKARLDLVVTDLGDTELRNIAEPVRVYSVEVGKPAQATFTARRRCNCADRRSRSGRPVFPRRSAQQYRSNRRFCSPKNRRN
jgi:hypothetical protein